jgi:hypothetical protein
VRKNPKLLSSSYYSLQIPNLGITHRGIVMIVARGGSLELPRRRFKSRLSRPSAAVFSAASAAACSAASAAKSGQRPSLYRRDRSSSARRRSVTSLTFGKCARCNSIASVISSAVVMARLRIRWRHARHDAHSFENYRFDRCAITARDPAEAVGVDLLLGLVRAHGRPARSGGRSFPPCSRKISGSMRAYTSSRSSGSAHVDTGGDLRGRVPDDHAGRPFERSGTKPSRNLDGLSDRHR